MGGLVLLQEVDGQELTFWRVNLDVPCGQRDDEDGSNEQQEQDQAARGEKSVPFS